MLAVKYLIASNIVYGHHLFCYLSHHDKMIIIHDISLMYLVENGVSFIEASAVKCIRPTLAPFVFDHNCLGQSLSM